MMADEIDGMVPIPQVLRCFICIELNGTYEIPPNFQRKKTKSKCDFLKLLLPDHMR